MSWLMIQAAFFSIAGLAMSWLTGWKHLAVRYRAPGKIQSISHGSHRWQNCRIRGISVSVASELYDEGWWIRPTFPLQIWMPALLIPWRQLGIADAAESMLGKRVTLRVACFSGEIVVRGVCAKLIESHVQEATQHREMT